MNLEKLKKIVPDSLMLGVTHFSLEQWGFDLLKKVDPDDLYTFIEEKRQLTLSEDALQWARPLSMKFGDILDKYDLEYVLDRVRAERPDLFMILITHPNGAEWLSTNLDYIRVQLGS